MTATPTPANEQDAPDRCIACREPMRPGQPYYPDESGGAVHAACLGPERECFTLNGRPLRPGEPIPAPYRWEP